MADTRGRLAVKIVDPTTNAQEASVDATGRLSVNTEMPDAAALADATANPTIPSVGALNLIYNGATWDRVRGDTANGIDVDVTRVTGTVTVDTEMPAAAVLADATANPTLPASASYTMGFNGTTWDRVRTANTGRLQVDVITGGGSTAPTSPQRNRATSASLAAGASVDLDSTQITSAKTGKLNRVIPSASVPLKVDLKTVLNGAATTIATFFVPANDMREWKPAHQNWVQQAESATAGFDGFRVTVTNNDNNAAADVYAYFEWDEV